LRPAFEGSPLSLGDILRKVDVDTDGVEALGKALEKENPENKVMMKSLKLKVSDKKPLFIYCMYSPSKSSLTVGVISSSLIHPQLLNRHLV